MLGKFSATADGIALGLGGSMLSCWKALGFAGAVLGALAVPAAAFAADPPIDQRIDQEPEPLAPRLTELRPQTHQTPELSNREEKTAALVAAHLRQLGLPVKTGVAKTGVTAVLQ